MDRKPDYIMLADNATIQSKITNVLIITTSVSDLYSTSHPSQGGRRELLRDLYMLCIGIFLLFASECIRNGDKRLRQRKLHHDYLLLPEVTFRLLGPDLENLFIDLLLYVNLVLDPSCDFLFNFNLGPHLFLFLEDFLTHTYSSLLSKK